MRSRRRPSNDGVFERRRTRSSCRRPRYNSAYNQPFADDPYVRIYQQIMTFTTLDGDTVTMPFEPKAIQDEHGRGLRPDYGRMSGFLGSSCPSGLRGTPNFILYSFIDPPTEIHRRLA